MRTAIFKLTENQYKDVVELMDVTNDAKQFRKLQAIKLHTDGMKGKDIANVVGVNRATVVKWIRKVRNCGLDDLLNDGRGGRRRAYVSLEEEKEFFKTVLKEAEKGTFITAEEIRKKFNKHFGINMSKSGFYSVLHRNDWRKVMPRKQHPKKADAKEIEASKKLKPNSKN